MTRVKPWVLLIIAVITGLAAVVVANSLILQRTRAAHVPLVVAAVDIEAGGRLTDALLKRVDWPVASVQRDAFTNINDLEGRYLKSALKAGEPVLASRIANQEVRQSLSGLVRQGRRAMNVRVNEVVGVQGFALPGNYVDVLVSTRDDDAQGGDRSRMVSKIVLQHILVLALAQDAGKDDTRPKSVNAVTLEVGPEQAEQLDLARSVGTLSLVLRNQTDPAAAQTPGATKRSLLGLAQPEPATAARVRTPGNRVPKVVSTSFPAAWQANCVEVIRGASKVTECF